MSGKLRPRFVLRLDDETYEALRLAAYTRHETMAEIARRATVAQLAEWERQSRPRLARRRAAP